MQTTPNNLLGIVRIMLGLIFIMTGTMKLTLDEYSSAWSIQLIEAQIPLYEFNVLFVPVFEVILGMILLSGYYSRIGAATVIPIMLVAIYVHLTVSNPAAFPAQPQLPIGPIAIIIMTVFVALKGGGKWSIDLIIIELSNIYNKKVRN